jgi:hypothetical protein
MPGLQAGSPVNRADDTSVRRVPACSPAHSAIEGELYMRRHERPKGRPGGTGALRQRRGRSHRPGYGLGVRRGAGRLGG